METLPGSWKTTDEARLPSTRNHRQRLALLALTVVSLCATAAPACAADWWTNMPPPVYGSTKIEVTDMGALGNGVHDDTQAFQDAIGALPTDGGIVHVAPGTYMINATRQLCPGQSQDDTPHCGILLRSHMKLSMAVGAVLVVIPNASPEYNLIMAHGVNNVEIIGGQIVGDRVQHEADTADPGEKGHGISIKGSTHVLIHWTEASKFWGDGFIIGANGIGSGNPLTLSDYVTVDHVTSSNNRRQGLSIVDGGQHILVENSTFSDTNGTAPSSGIDIEPNDPTVVTTTALRLANNTMSGNDGNGVEIHAGTSDIAVVGNSMPQNQGSGVYAKGTAYLSVDNDDIESNGLPGVQFVGTTHDASLTNSTVMCNNMLYNPPGNCSGGGLARDLVIGPDTYNITRSNNQFTPQ